MSDPFKDVAEASVGKPHPDVIYWEKELDLAKKRDKKWREEADRVVKLYEGKKKLDNSFNILYANTETLLPACYNQLPRPIVERRFKDSDPLARASSQALERTLAYLMDSPDAGYEQFSALMEQAILGALVPGRGVTRFLYEPEFEDSPTALGDAGEEGGGGSEEEGEDDDIDLGEGESLTPETGERLAYETICGKDVDWDAFYMGWSRRWVDTPWIAFFHAMSEEDLEANFGKELAEKIPKDDPSEKDSEGWKKAADPEGENNRGSTKVANVYEIWQKGTKKVLFYCPEYKEGLLKEVDDPLGLSGFYPCPQPLTFLLKRSEQTPTPLYVLYEEQAKELNRLSQRINRILNALKVRGFYDGSIQGLKDLLSSDDNTLLPAKNVASLQDGKNLQNSIWMMPLNELITVLQQLLQGREACKQTIYEITGIADIMRGQGQASETATAQNIKNQWGTLRLKRMQRYVQDYVRDSLRIVGEIAGRHFALETFEGMTNLDYATPEAIAQAKSTQMMVQQAQLQAPPGTPPPGQQPGTPPGAPSPQLPPQLAQAAQQAAATLAKPAWEQVVGLLRDDLQRNYRIDIETNSTIDATSQEDKQNIVDAMGAIANTMQSFAQPMQMGLIPMPAFKSIMMSIARRFEFGRQVEEALEQIPDQPPPPPPDPAAGKAQAEAQALQQKSQLDAQTAQAKIAAEQQKAQLEAQVAQQELQQKAALAQQDLAFKQQEFDQKLQFQAKEFELKMQLQSRQGMMDAEAARQDSMMKMQTAQQDAALKAQSARQGMDIKGQQAAQAAQIAARKPKPTAPAGKSPQA